MVDLVKLSQLLPKEALKWTVDEAQIWLEHINIEKKYRDLLKQKQFDGACFEGLSLDILKNEYQFESLQALKIINWKNHLLNEYSEVLKKTVQQKMSNLQIKDTKKQNKSNVIPQKQQQQIEESIYLGNNNTQNHNYDNEDEDLQILQESIPYMGQNNQQSFNQISINMAHQSNDVKVMKELNEDLFFSDNQVSNCQTQRNKKSQMLANDDDDGLNNNNLFNSMYSQNGFQPQQKNQNTNNLILQSFHPDSIQMSYNLNSVQIHDNNQQFQQTQKAFSINQSIPLDNNFNPQFEIESKGGQTFGKYSDYNNNKIYQSGESFNKQYDYYQQTQLNVYQENTDYHVDDRTIDKKKMSYKDQMIVDDSTIQKQRFYSGGKQQIYEIKDGIVQSENSNSQIIYKLNKNKTLTIGRHSSNIMVVQEESVSRYHSEITFNLQLQKFQIKDIGSSTGTYLKLKEPLLLKTGFIFEIGSNLFQVIMLDESKGNLELTIIEGPNFNNKQQKWSINLNQYKQNSFIGRSQADCDVCIPNDQHISSKHSKIFFNNQQFYIQDQSLNGTWLRLSEERKESGYFEMDQDEIFKIGQQSQFKITYVNFQYQTDQSLSNLDSCLVCRMEDRKIYQKECQHVTMCSDCSKNFKNCMICKSDIVSKLEVKLC